MTFEDMMQASYQNDYFDMFRLSIIIGVIILAFLTCKVKWYWLLIVFLAFCYTSSELAFMAILEKWDFRFQWLQNHSETATEAQSMRITTDGANKVFGPFIMTVQASFFYLCSIGLSRYLKKPIIERAANRKRSVSDSAKKTN